MYHVISTGISALILYFISSLFYRSGFYSRSFHRKFWNTILALTFLLTAIAGLFLALQINYKWNIPFIKTILKWHVECGIGFTFTGILHFLWHSPYYLKSVRDEEGPEKEPEYHVRSARDTSINLFMIGLVSSSVQLLLMREMMNIAGGYELVTGTFLGSWLIGSAAGAAMAKRSKTGDIRKINIAFGTSPFVSLFLLILLSGMLLSPGETPSFLVSLILTLLVLLPFTFISGFAFIRIMLISGKSDNQDAGKMFSAETAGGVTAGFIVSSLGSGVLNTYQTLFLVLAINIFYITVTFFPVKQKHVAALILVAAIVCFLLLYFNPDIPFRQLLLPAIKVTDTRDTHYGNITTGEYLGEKSIYYNHHLLKWKNDETEREENIHYSMIQRDSIRNVLIISGDINSMFPEILKYHVLKVWYVERDPALLNYYDLDDRKSPVLLIKENADAFGFVKESRETFDIILMILPPPSTLLLNRYYTTDFFAEVKKKLSKTGVFACSPGAGENYFNKESAKLYSSLFNSLASEFKNVLPIVGNKLYYLASDGELSSDICRKIAEKGISNVYVGPDFLSDDLIKMKSDQLLNMLDRNEKQNRLSVPVACFHFQNFNLSKSAGERIPSLVLMILVFLLPLFLVRSKSNVMYSVAGALAGFEIVLLLLLQATAGNMYQFTGLLISGIMTGLALGSGINSSGLKRFSVNVTSLLLVLFYIIIGFIINMLLSIDNKLSLLFILMILTLVPSFFTGHLFRILVETRTGNQSPSDVYSADLAGSALGFIAVSAILLPLLGMQLTIFLLSAFIFAGLLLGTIGNK